MQDCKFAHSLELPLNPHVKMQTQRFRIWSSEEHIDKDLYPQVNPGGIQQGQYDNVSITS